MRVELHCHSTCSDGSLAPEVVAERAAARAVEIFCLTDHDTLDGCAATEEVLAGRAAVVRGLELSCTESGRGVHLLVYLPPDANVEGVAVLADRLVQQRRDRVDRLRAIVTRLQELGIELDAEAILAANPDKAPGRPDVARALVEVGACTSIREAFTRWLRDGGPAEVPASKISLAEGLALGTGAGAKMSLAHPHTLGREERVAELYTHYRAQGLEGLEVHYGRYTAAQRRGWRRVAQRFDLVETAGSDFHGDVLPEVSRPVVEVDDAIGRRLASWLGVGPA